MLIGFRQYLLNELLDECDIWTQFVLEPAVIFGIIVNFQMYLINVFTLDSDEEIGNGPYRNSNTPTMVPPRYVYRGRSTICYSDLSLT